MLWTLVRDFFVQYIFGGCNSEETLYYGFMGYFGDSYNSFSEDNLNTTLQVFKVGDFYVSLGDYLSTLATIITMVAIVLICCAFIKKIYNMCAHIIG